MGGEGGAGGGGGVGHWSTQLGWFDRLQCSTPGGIYATVVHFQSTHKGGFIRLQLWYPTIPQRGAILPDYELKSGKTAPLLLTPLLDTGHAADSQFIVAYFDWAWGRQAHIAPE